MKKKGKGVAKILTYVVFLLMWAFVGYMVGMMMPDLAPNLSDVPGGGILFFAGAICGLYVALILQTILHELGHLVFGLLSGYRFCSFRIGSFMWVESDEGIRFARRRMAGTMGQCLMTPPDDWKTASVLPYHLGGCLMNLIVAGLCFGVRALAGSGGIVGYFCMVMALVGVMFALANGLPLKTSTLNNDGSNALEALRSQDARRALWQQMKLAEAMAAGQSLRDMPETFFFLPEGADMSNSLIASIAVFQENRLMDSLNLDAARAMCQRLLQADTGIIGLHRCQLCCDQAYCAAISERESADMTAFLEKSQQRMMKRMASDPSVIRTQYAVALLHDRDLLSAQKWQGIFDEAIKNYPYAGAVAGEKELMALADATANRQENAAKG